MMARASGLVLLVAVVAVGFRLTSGDAPPVDAGLGAGEQAASGLGAASATWFCAAGMATGGWAEQTVVIRNPTEQVLRGHITMYTADEAPREPLAVRVPSGDERRVQPEAVGNVEDGAFVAMLVELDQPGGAVEHEVQGDDGRDRAPCVDRAASTWYLPWGRTTRDARDYVVMFNPFPSDVVVDVVFSTPDGAREPDRWQGIVVPGRRLVAMDVAADVTRRAHVTATVQARNGSLVVERLQTLDGTVGPTGLWLLPGHAALQTVATFDGGRLDGDAQELIVVHNPHDVAAEVEVAVQPKGSGPAPEPFRLILRPGRGEVLDYRAERRVDQETAYVTEVHSPDLPVVVDQVILP